ncbi:hypothetical protein [Nakamurella panacisegetis]|uniref:hypothetical protein n=1 Tax=Nakamurella panacisegetis TaxID=1090615 RepID=UPI0012FD6560|nr:hypothetical protein [Nakamurella panacisegetis]
MVVDVVVDDSTGGLVTGVSVAGADDTGGTVTWVEEPVAAAAVADDDPAVAGDGTEFDDEDEVLPVHAANNAPTNTADTANLMDVPRIFRPTVPPTSLIRYQCDDRYVASAADRVADRAEHPGLFEA